MPLLARKLCGHERPDDFTGKLRSDDPRAKAQHVHIIVLDALVRGVVVVAQPGANTGELVRRYRYADAAAADDDRALRMPLPHRLTHELGKIRVVVSERRVVCTKVRGFIPRRPQVVQDDLLQWIPSMVG